MNSKEAKAKIPQVLRFFFCIRHNLYYWDVHLQVVIDFYESKLAWFTGEGEDSQEE